MSNVSTNLNATGYFNRNEFMNRLHELGYSQGYFADKVGISSAYMSQIKCGKAGPSSALLKRMADYLGCRVSDLWIYPDGRGDSVVCADNLTDSRSMILDSLRVLRGVCRENIDVGCMSCPLSDNGECVVFNHTPNEWHVTDQRVWKAFK